MTSLTRRIRRYRDSNRILRFLPARASLRTVNIEGFHMRVDISDGGIGRGLYHNGEREKAFMHLLKTEIEAGMIAIDIGANIGYATLFMLRSVGTTGKVFAVEPDPHNLKMLTKNVVENGFHETASIHKLALSNKAGEAKFYLASAPNLNSMSNTGITTRGEIVTQTDTLTSFFTNQGVEPNFLKMDVEGHEVEILAGGFDLFKNTKRTVKILIETHPQFYSEDHDFAAQLEKYFGIGFNVKYVVSTPIARPQLFKDKGYWPAMTVPTDGRVRGIYDDITHDDAIYLSCFSHREKTPKETSNKIVRSLMLQKN